MLSLGRVSFPGSRLNMVKSANPSKAHSSLRQNMIRYVTSVSIWIRRAAVSLMIALTAFFRQRMGHRHGLAD